MKKNAKKMILNRETLRLLDAGSLRVAGGGVTEFSECQTCSCETCVKTNCNTTATNPD